MARSYGSAATLLALKEVNREEHADVPVELMKWVWAGGRKLKGLLKRRRAEVLLYAT